MTLNPDQSDQAILMRLASNSALKTVDMHTGGEPVRILRKPIDFGDVSTVLQKRKHLQNNLDHIRRMLIMEPRGHYDMYGCVLVDSPNADFGVIFMHNAGYSTMCGHAVIALGRFAIDFGLVQPKPAGSPEPEVDENRQQVPVSIEAPCGVVNLLVSYDSATKKTGRVTYESVPSFLYQRDVRVDVPGFGSVVLDVSYGGTFYALCEVEQLGLSLGKSKIRDLVDAATAVSEATRKCVELKNDDNPDTEFLYGTILTDGERQKKRTVNVCVFADAEVDRSPTGSGVQARIAQMFEKKEIELGEEIEFVAGATGSVFLGKAVREVDVGAKGRHGVIVQV